MNKYGYNGYVLQSYKIQYLVTISQIHTPAYVRKNVRKGAAEILHTNRKISAALEILKF